MLQSHGARLQKIYILQNGFQNYYYKCKEKGHYARKCPQGLPSTILLCRTNNNIENMKCFKCNLPGHIARDCKEKEKLCFDCREPGHEQRYCPQGVIRFNNTINYLHNYYKSLR